jgi:hypothetical protein
MKTNRGKETEKKKTDTKKTDTKPSPEAQPADSPKRQLWRLLGGWVVIGVVRELVRTVLESFLH